MVVEELPTEEWHFHKIDGGKSVFAEEIVPELDVECFANFKLLFSRILEILKMAGAVEQRD